MGLLSVYDKYVYIYIQVQESLTKSRKSGHTDPLALVQLALQEDLSLFI